MNSTVLRYKLPQTLAEAHLEIINQARQADEAEQYVIEYPVVTEEENRRLWEQNRILRAENKGLKLALAEALRPNKMAEAPNGGSARFEKVSAIDLAKAIFSDRIADGPHTLCAEIIAQFPGGLWRCA
jgi:hypothetical protein